MIKSLLKPIRYILSDDARLRFSQWQTRLMGSCRMGRYILRKRYHTPAQYLKLEALGMKFSSPIGLAAGFDTDGHMIDAMEATGFGFIEVGSITTAPQHLNSFPTLHRLPADRALLYNGQIDSEGVESVIENIKQRRRGIIVGCNIAKSADTDPEDAPLEYLRLFRPLYQYADYFTINICCNTTKETYVPSDREQVMAILQPLFEFRRGQNQYRPILLKISPDLSDEQIDAMTDIMIESQLDGIVACGGTTGRYGLERSAAKMHSLGRTAGIISGKPLKRRSIDVIRRILERSKGAYPIIGCGGVCSPDDAMDMINAGATLVQIGTEYIYGGGKSVRRIREGLNERLRKANKKPIPKTE